MTWRRMRHLSGFRGSIAALPVVSPRAISLRPSRPSCASVASRLLPNEYRAGPSCGFAAPLDRAGLLYRRRSRVLRRARRGN
jgi:hypothetical protein